MKGTQSNEREKEKYQLEQEIGRMKEQHRRHMDAIQTLWRERENRREEDEAHRSVLVPLEEQISQMKEGFDEERERLLMKLEESYDLHTGRDRKVHSPIGMQNHYIKSGLCSLLACRSLWVHQGREAVQLQRNVCNSYHMPTRAIAELLHQARGCSLRAVCNNFGTARVGM